MKQKRKRKLYVFIVLWLLCTIFVEVEVEGRNHKNCKKHRGHGSACNSTNNVFNILSFGAKGDGVSDDSKELVEAWKAACKVSGGVIQIPSQFKFLIKPITLQGPCMPHLIFQIDGTLLAPPKIGAWSKSKLFQWMNFKWIDNFTIQGSGTLDGQGYNWWPHFPNKHIPNIKPTAVRFYSSQHITVQDIRIKDSPQIHLKFDDSNGVKVNNVTISAPSISPNTDGIHLQNTRDVEILHSNIGTGDDCVSIQTGCSNIHINHVHCGPGHGISLGGLGKDGSMACVSNILIENIIMQNTLYGARIKTWQGGTGLVKNITFSNIEVADVNYPVVIDQYYCDKQICKNQTRAIQITEVKFDKIIGSYLTQPIHLACSDDVPCTEVDLIDIELKPSRGSNLGGSQIQQGLCWNSYGKSQGPLVPSSMNYCLKKDDGGSMHRISRYIDKLC